MSQRIFLLSFGSLNEEIDQFLTPEEARPEAVSLAFHFENRDEVTGAGFFV